MPRRLMRDFPGIDGCFVSLQLEVLGGPERADEAVANRWLSASRNPPQFKYDGAFCSSLVRILVDEALAIVPWPGYEHSGAPIPSQLVL